MLEKKLRQENSVMGSCGEGFVGYPSSSTVGATGLLETDTVSVSL